MNKVSLKNINKLYDNDYKAVDNFNLDIKPHEFIVLVGPSGCGKSTTLRMIAGLEDISSGELIINNKLMNNVPPKKRDIAMVFQNYALYPHMTVRQNIGYGLKVRKVPKKEANKKIEDAAKILGLSDLLDRKPGELSGGQRQRVALGRAVVRDGDIFLMDEPLSNLDAKLRVVMRSEILQLHERMNSTTIYVTHDQIEAMTMADRIVIMDKGVIQQIGTPREIYNNPVNLFVASFIGTPPMNLMNVELREDCLILIDGDTNLSITPDKSTLDKLRDTNKSRFIMGIRPENIGLIESGDDQNCIPMEVTLGELYGSEMILHTHNNDLKVVAKVSPEKTYEKDDLVKLKFDYNKLHFFDVDTERGF